MRFCNSLVFLYLILFCLDFFTCMNREASSFYFLCLFSIFDICNIVRSVYCTFRLNLIIKDKVIRLFAHNHQIWTVPNKINTILIRYRFNINSISIRHRKDITL
ncbi:hypothetical protein RIR_jg30188.t1 [Rhizophagus irregularis DAOM 181602=DAOM 197198]|nr:hypothetical protein RIR_jg30188.t1 [Rhizophagus irregularis DAOM 181602=DAOM 197198]